MYQVATTTVRSEVRSHIVIIVTLDADQAMDDVACVAYIHAEGSCYEQVCVIVGFAVDGLLSAVPRATMSAVIVQVVGMYVTVHSMDMLCIEIYMQCTCNK